MLSPLIVAIKQKPRLLGLEAKRAQIVKSDFALNEAVQFIPTPGGAGRSSRRGRAHHRRHDPLADPGTLSRARHAR